MPVPQPSADILRRLFAAHEDEIRSLLQEHVSADWVWEFVSSEAVEQQEDDALRKAGIDPQQHQVRQRRLMGVRLTEANFEAFFYVFLKDLDSEWWHLTGDLGVCGASLGLQAGVSRLQSGRRCCSTYCRMISNGAPPHDAAK